MPRSPDGDSTLMIRPHRFRIIPGRQARAIRNAPFRLVSITLTQTSSSTCVSRPGGKIAALLTRISTGPRQATTSRTTASTWCMLRTSQARARTAAPRRHSAAAVSCSGSSCRPVIATAAPASGSVAASARPRPLPPPVTIATLPSSIMAAALTPTSAGARDGSNIRRSPGSAARRRARIRRTPRNSRPDCRDSCRPGTRA